MRAVTLLPLMVIAAGLLGAAGMSEEFLCLTLACGGAVLGIAACVLLRRGRVRAAGLARANERLQRELANAAGAKQELAEARDRLQEQLRRLGADLSAANAQIRESETRYHSFLQSFKGIVFRADPDFRPVFLYGAVESLTGYSAEDLLSGAVRWDEIVHPDDLPRLRYWNRETFSVAGSSISNEYRIVRKDGEIRWVHDFVQSVTDESGKSAYMQGVLHDVTSQKRAERLLEQSRERFERMADHIADGLTIIEDGKVVYANPSAREIFGYSEGQSLSPGGMEAATAGSDPAPDGRPSKSPPAGFPGESEFWIACPDGTHRFVHNHYSVGTTGDGLPVYYVVTTDLTDQKLAEDALRESEQRFRALFQHAADAILIYDIEGFYLDANEQACALYGYTREEFMNLRMRDLVTAEHAPHLPERVRQLQEQGRLVVESVNVRRDGAAFPVEVSTKLIEFLGRPAALVVVRDITERKKAEEALRESEKRFRTLFDQAGDAILIQDADGRVLEANRTACAQYGYSRDEMIGLGPASLWSQTAEQTKESLQSGRGVIEAVHVRRDKREFPVEISIRSVTFAGRSAFLCIVRDVGERKRMEETLKRQEHLAAVGQLAAGIAHDFNNILNVILGYGETLLAKSALPPPQRAKLDIMVKQGKRAADLVRQILDFSRQTISRPTPLSLDSVLMEQAGMFKRVIPETIRIHLEFDGEECLVRADPTQIRQVLANLVLNARDAIQGPGAITLGLRRLRLAAGQAPPCAGMAAGDWVVLSVADTGSGIAPEHLPHIFEPFFTTKEVGKGTGLGLAQVYGIVQQHKGFIDVRTDVGTGSTFTVYLPAADALYAPTPTPAEGPPAIRPATVLVVEDEHELLLTLKAMLENMGCQVLLAHGGQEACQVYGKSAGAIDVVLTDMVMPGMSGPELFDALRARNPEVKVIMMTGYPLGDERKRFLDRGLTDVLMKPLDSFTLARTIAAALQEPRS